MLLFLIPRGLGARREGLVPFQTKMADESEEIEVEPSFLIVNKQLQDLIRVQNTALTKFQAMVCI